jgi:hypothetical protein
MDSWRAMAVRAGLPGLFLVAEHSRPDWDPASHGYDATVTINLPPLRPIWFPWTQPIEKIRGKIQELRGHPTIYRYEDVIDGFVFDPVPGIESFPCLIPGWDNSPRSGSNGRVLHGSTPEAFRRHVRRALDRMSNVPRERRLIFIKSWNEWAEGNHLEPDLKFGHGYLKVLRDETRDPPAP